MKYLSEEDFKIAESNGISRHNAFQRFYYYGWTKEKSITEPMRSANTRLYKQRCKEIGLSYRTFCRRLERGWSAERALMVPVDKRFSRVQ